MAQDYDVIVVGAGTAGIPTAIAAADRGARVLLIEQSDDIGGALHVSAGQMSAAGTRLQRARGIDDSPRQHFEDALRISKETCDPKLVNIAVNIAAETVDWLIAEGFDMHPDCPKIFYGHEAYAIARTYWGVNGGRSILRVLRKQLNRRLFRGNRLTLALNTMMVGLLQEQASAPVTGVRVANPAGGSRDILAKNVVLTTGGYGANPRLFRQFTEGRKLFSATATTSTGTGILLGAMAGGYVRNAHRFLPTFGGIELRDAPGRSDFYEAPNLTPQTRQPWEIYVNLHGQRFVAEDHPSPDARENALMEQPELTFWIVYDARAQRESPALLGGEGFAGRSRWTPEAVAQAFRDHPSFQMADSIEALASRCRLGANALVASVADYNEAVERGTDAFGRKSFPAPIREAPFHAIKAHGIVLKTPGGLAINTEFAVIRADKQPIPNLYAVGEAIGGGTLSGKSFVGGMSVTPALGFGRMLGRSILRW
jgi:fumarate reductase flavoprotein subunit